MNRAGQMDEEWCFSNRFMEYKNYVTTWKKGGNRGCQSRSRKLKIQSWSKIAMKRDIWKKTVEQAKPHKEL